MLDTLTTANHQDFARRYGGTFGWFVSPNGKKILVSVGEASAAQVNFTDVRGSMYYAISNSGVQFEFIPVDRGFFNGKHGTFLLMRVPARQWHRGIHPNNTQVMIPQGDQWTRGRVDILTLHNIFVDGVPLKVRLEEFLAGKQDSVALSKHFAINMNKLYFYNRVIGTYANKVLTLDDDLVKQEIMDVLRRNNIEWEVKINES